MKIPNDWKMAKFGELAKITCGVAATPEYVDAAIGVPFLSARNVQKERLDLSYFQHIPRELHEKLTKNTKPAKGDVLLTRVGAGIGEAAVVDIDFEFSVYVSLTLIKCGKYLDSEYVKSLLNTNYYRYLATRDQFAGGGVQNLNVQMVKEYPIPVPPLSEQKKIAQILSTWDKAITVTEKLLANSQQQKKALMQQLLTGKKRLLDKNGVRFGGGWKTTTISKFIKESRVAGSSGDTAKKLTVKLYGNGVVAKEEKRIGSESTKYYRRSAGQFIYSKLDFLNGAFGIIPNHLDGYESTLDLPAFDFLDGVCIQWFLYFVTRKEFYTANLGLANGGRKARRVNPSDLLKVRIPTPSPEEQQKIAAVLSAADQEIAALQKKLDALKQEKKALMQQLLTGKRRVKI